jgi:hypothetical protein
VVASVGCTTLRWGAAPHRRDKHLQTHLKLGSQTGVTLNKPHYAGEAVFEYGGISESLMLAGRTFAVARFHPQTDDGNDENESTGAGFGQMILGGANISKRLDVYSGIGYVFAGFTGPRVLLGATLWAITTDAGGGYTVNVELDWYRGSRDREMGVVDTDHHFSLSVGLELGLGKATFGL